MPAGVAEPALAGGLLPHVAVVEHPQLVAEQVGDRGDVAAHVGDDPHPDLVGDLGSGSGKAGAAVDGPAGLGGERLDALGAAGRRSGS